MQGRFIPVGLSKHALNTSHTRVEVLEWVMATVQDTHMPTIDLERLGAVWLFSIVETVVPPVLAMGQTLNFADFSVQASQSISEPRTHMPSEPRRPPELKLEMGGKLRQPSKLAGSTTPSFPRTPSKIERKGLQRTAGISCEGNQGWWQADPELQLVLWGALSV